MSAVLPSPRMAATGDRETTYRVEIGRLDEPTWSAHLAAFDDASIHQTRAAGEVMKGEQNLQHVVLRQAGDVVGLCQVSLRRLLPGLVIADAYAGPLWRRKGRPADIGAFRRMVDQLRMEYAVRCGCYLRVWPNEFDLVDGPHECVGALLEMGFRQNAAAVKQRTLLLDLSPSVDVLRKNLGNTWRLHLNRAEKSALTVVEGTGDDLYEVFLGQLHQLITRKGFVPQVDYAKFKLVQRALPDAHKMRIVVAMLDGKPVSSLVCAAVGDTGIYMFGATADDALKTHASNLLHWNTLQWLKQRGVAHYDLGGIDPEENPGTYQFKRGLGGKIAEDRTRVGEFDYANGVRGRFVRALVDRILPLRESFRHLAHRYRS